MEPKFQTSFIPKKQNAPITGSIGPSSVQRPKVRGTSIFKIIGIFLFILSILAVGGAYGWKYYLTSQNEKYKIDLASREKQFNIELIEKLKQINVQIDSAKKIVNNHVAVSQIFDILQKITIADVRFMSMDYKTSEDGGAAISMKGQGRNLAAVAFQSDVLNKLSDYGLANILKNPMVFEPVLDETGFVSFGFSAGVDKNSVSYKKAVSGSNP